MKKRANRALFVLLIVLVCFMGVSCGGNSSSTSTSSTSGTSGRTTTADASTVSNIATTTADVEESFALTDQTINIGYGTAIDSLTPFRSNTGRNSPYLMQLYETLGVLTEDLELVPYVAKQWHTEDNGYTYEIEIWDYVYDSAGNHITSSDIVWFINESKAKALKPVFAKVASAEVVDDYVLTLSLTDNIVGTFDTLMMDIYVMSEEAYKSSPDEFGSTCVSTSPYLCTSFVPSASISFERRDDYWQDISLLPECVRPLVKNVNYMIILEAFQLGVALETGTVDAVIDIASSTGAQFVNNNSVTIDLSDGPQGWQIFFSGDDSSILANNEALRQAICYAIDENGLITAMTSGFGTQMWDVCSPRIIGFNRDWMEEDYYSYDPDKARELIKESGYNGETLVLLSTSSAFASRLAQILQNYLLAVGINVSLNSVDMALYTAIRLDGSKYDMTINTVGGTSLADVWSIRFDPAAYSAGDATGRNDYVLAEMLYSTWTEEGWTEENINAVHNYIKESAIAYGLVNPQVFTIWNNNLNMEKVVKGGISGYVMFPSCQFSK